MWVIIDRSNSLLPGGLDCPEKDLRYKPALSRPSLFTPPQAPKGVIPGREAK